jgi:hypothetical protein
MKSIQRLFMGLCMYNLTNSFALLSQELLWIKLVEEHNRPFFIKKLGWDPDITLYYDPTDNSVVYNTACTIYCHGWGENQTSLITKQMSNSLPGTVIGFNFQDAVRTTKRPQWHKTSFGQKNDCRALILVLKLLDESGCEAIHLLGYSRGGTTISNSIRRLQCHTLHKKFFQKLGISKAQAESIVAKIHAGTIILDCPLLDVRAVVRHKFPSLCGFIDYIVCPLATWGKYIPWKEQAIDAAPFLKDFNLLVHFQHDDEVVTNVCDTDFYDALKSPTAHRIFGNDGGHFHEGQTLRPALHAFRKRYNGPHYQSTDLLEQGECLLADSQPN